jgi:hypothetical protein
MTSSTVPAPRSGLVAPSTTRFDRLMRAEAIKMFSLRSTGWTLLALLVITVGISILACWGTMQAPAEEITDLDAVSLTLAGLGFGQLAVAVLGAMTIASEYSTGGIRSTLTAVPSRLSLLGAKAVVFFVVAFVVGALTCVIAFVVGNLFLHEQYRSGFGDPHVARALFGGALYVAGSGMYGFALGALIRQTAGAITAAVALLFVLPPLSMLLPGDWGDTVTRHFTSNAGQQVMATIPPGDNLGVWTGFFWFTLEWVVLLVVAAILMRRRDA